MSRVPHGYDVFRTTLAFVAVAMVALLAVFFLVPFGASISAAFGDANPTRPAMDAAVLRSLIFTLGQAAASSALAVIIGLPGAFLVARRKFPGRRLLSSLSLVPLGVPPVLVALGFAMFFGKEGAANHATTWLFGFPLFDFLYTAPGLVIVHALYNFPLVVRIVGDSWARIPGTTEDAARSLGASEPRVLFWITLPQLSPAIGAAAALVFLYSFFSFVIALLIGGLSGTTIEVELYRAARIDLEFRRAAFIAISETVAALGVVGLYALCDTGFAAPSSGGTATRNRKSLALFERPAAFVYFALIAFFLLGPLASIVARSFSVRAGYAGATTIGFDNYLKTIASPSFPRAVGITLFTGIVAAGMAVLSGAAFAAIIRAARISRLARAAVNTAALFPLAVSTSALTFGWSLLASSIGALRAPIPTGFPLLPALAVAAAQAASAFPLVARSVAAALARLPEVTLDAARSLGSTSVNLAMRITLPVASRALLTGAAFSFAVSVGDATAPLMLASGVEPAALLVYRNASGYRLGEACALGTMMAAATSFVFLIKDENSNVV